MDGRAPKLSPKYYGPFKILEKIGTSAYKIDIPEQWSIHPVINASKLKPYHECEDKFITREKENYYPPPDIKDSDQEWEVERIVNTRLVGRKKRREYLVLWKGYPEWDRTWEPEDHLINASDAVKEFWKSQQDQLRLVSFEDETL